MTDNAVDDADAALGIGSGGCIGPPRRAEGALMGLFQSRSNLYPERDRLFLAIPKSRRGAFKSLILVGAGVGRGEHFYTE